MIYLLKVAEYMYHRSSTTKSGSFLLPVLFAFASCSSGIPRGSGDMKKTAEQTSLLLIEDLLSRPDFMMPMSMAFYRWSSTGRPTRTGTLNRGWNLLREPGTHSWIMLTKKAG